MKVSDHFYRDEFACECNCGFAAVDIELLMLLEQLRTYYRRPVVINSACRCDAHNKAVGGADGSKHRLGIAADVVVTGISPDDVYNYLNGIKPHSLGLGLYDTFVHLDVREIKARW